jgi:hypothetical protein
MYRSVMAFYITPASLRYKQRRLIANHFTITPGPHGASMNNIVKAIQPAFRQMHTGVDVDVNGTKTLMIACPIMISGDMP